MLIVTTFNVPGRNINQTLGLVKGNTIRARHVGKDIIAALRAVVGGELHEYTKLLSQSREQAMERLIAQANGLNADAVINIRFSTAMVVQAASEILVYGTAVKFNK